MCTRPQDGKFASGHKKTKTKKKCFFQSLPSKQFQDFGLHLSDRVYCVWTSVCHTYKNNNREKNQ